MTLLVVLSVLAVLLLVGALAIYLVLITRKLASVSSTLGRVAFGVRAVETQTSSIGPSATRLNEELEAAASALQDLDGTPRAGL